MTVVACPQCNALNRIGSEHNPVLGKCGKCKSPLFAGVPVELNSRNFDAHVVKSDLPVIVDFWAEWCGPCKMMGPVFAQSAVQIEPDLRFGKLNTETEQSIAARYSIRSIPTLIVFQRGKEIDRISGALNGQQLIQWIRQTIQK